MRRPGGGAGDFALSLRSGARAETGRPVATRRAIGSHASVGPGAACLACGAHPRVQQSHQGVSSTMRCQRGRAGDQGSPCSCRRRSTRRRRARLTASSLHRAAGFRRRRDRNPGRDRSHARSVSRRTDRSQRRAEQCGYGPTSSQTIRRPGVTLDAGITATPAWGWRSPEPCDRSIRPESPTKTWSTT